jgi:hypothetical protein
MLPDVTREGVLARPGVRRGKSRERFIPGMRLLFDQTPVPLCGDSALVERGLMR